MENPKKTFRLMVASMGFHRQIALRLQRAGFTVRRIVRQQIHPVWEAHLNLANVPTETGEERLRSEICHFLRKHCARCSAKEINVTVSGDRVRAAFLWEGGESGWMSFYRGEEEWHRGYEY